MICPGREAKAATSRLPPRIGLCFPCDPPSRTCWTKIPACSVFILHSAYNGKSWGTDFSNWQGKHLAGLPAASQGGLTPPVRKRCRQNCRFKLRGVLYRGPRAVPCPVEEERNVPSCGVLARNFYIGAEGMVAPCMGMCDTGFASHFPNLFETPLREIQIGRAHV